MIGATLPTSRELTRASERISFIYVEHSIIHREDSAITATDTNGTVHIPAASLGALLLGPGTRITHHAMMLLADCGVTAVWVGEHGVRYYAHGTSTAKTARLLQAQADKVSNTRKRLEVARTMYSMRFPNEDVADLTMQQLRGKEGARVRKIYREHSERTGVAWNSRKYDPNNFGSSDPINKALSAAHACLYGAVHAIVVALGCSPGLGFVHTGHSRAFIYDIADLYKAEITIPAAFDVVAESTEDIGSRTRRAVREKIKNSKIMQQCAHDIQRLLVPAELDEGELYADVVSLWGERGETVESGQNYGGAGA
ncbi:type I-E CRISPR-associated endonuclease Cas1e [Rothia sp. ZJ932]|uniref:type I-E CRISPR-associated endonuclease Cas1e n=1 Tax=Rothia sp. ZJ932 TaxID=2810516 RepID=UPI001968309D|nr:type I-E CRISPR-associated endonuclease Cas1e [Rothia sp. ZJ932]QRZ61435.1 type I-E CRISPR-associated endonuclease Cas1 [Rothia sp. ZJ932]